MNRKNMKYIEKELRNNNELIIKYIPTQEEINYLKSRGITTEKVFYNMTGIISNTKVSYQFTKYSKL